MLTAGTIESTFKQNPHDVGRTRFDVSTAWL